MLVLRAFSYTHTAIPLFKVLFNIPIIQAIFQLLSVNSLQGKVFLCSSHTYSLGATSIQTLMTDIAIEKFVPVKKSDQNYNFRITP